MATLRRRESGTLLNRTSSSQLRAATPTMASVASNGTTSSDGTSVQVAVRIRPLTSHDQSAIPARWQKLVVNALSTNAVQVDASGQPPPGGMAPPPGAAKRPNFTFDRVLSPNDGQEQVYNASVLPLIHRFMEGYNVTILAYGQTSSGKSYTMGTSLSVDDDFEGLVSGQRAHPNTGIIPRAVAQIFDEIRHGQQRNPNTQYTAKASFIEIYNEELIDLLADGVDNRPLVQIREDKAGHIIWSGLREVRVQSVPDVMNYLLQGSAVRRTNETDMNAQSSRSHAIFSLTLMQRRYTGSNAIATSSNQTGTRTSSALGHRSSMLPRSTTPTTGRSTPTGRSSGLPRPSSRIMSPTRSNAATPNPSFSAGLTPGRADGKSVSAADAGEWVTVTSKFHFVDLAGSERLKRTAAQGDRVKEGISINSGLHALGNVISALGDPAKSRRTTHIPYRDSKLTRLLQDSLGGNAYTLMIACVSPTEYNVNETINTLQYANRARNIKNKAELNEVEVGWDDVAYLQAQVLKLRKELQIIKGFRTGTAGSEAAFRAMDQKDVLEWQSKYASLSQKYSQLTAEMTQVQQQANKESMSNDDYLKAAEPIIIEYEKTVDALEGQINLMKAALGHSEDVILAHEQAANEREVKIVAMERDLESREQTVADLQARLTKLEDREASAERYAREMEARLALHASTGDADAQAVADLRRDLTKHREVEGRREEYIKELESRLTSAEESVAPLQASIVKAEQEVERREEAYREVQQRMELLDSSKDNKALLVELEQRDLKLLDLESKLASLQTERDDVVRERGKLTDAAATHQLERGKLEDQIRQLKSSATAALGSGSGTILSTSRQPSTSTATAGTPNEEELSFLQTQVEMLSEELKSNQEVTAKIQADLLTLETKYKQSLTEIDDLNRQVSEAKLIGPPSPVEKETDVPSHARRSSLHLSNGRKGRPESLLLDNTPGRRKSLSRRSSNSFLGYNPRESTPRDGTQTPRSALPLTPGSESNKASEQDPAQLFRTRSLSQSLGQELQSGGRRHLSLSGSADFAKIGWPGQQAGQSLEAAPVSPVDLERKVRSLEAETMRLQETLKERDEEITELERATKKGATSQAVGAESINGSSSAIASDKINDVRAPKNSLSFPSTTTAAKNAAGVDEESSAQLGEIMRSLARKEQEAMRQVEQLKAELQEQKREKDALASMQENQQQNWLAEIESMREREVRLTAEIGELRAKTNDDAEKRLADVRNAHAEASKLLQDEHESSLTEVKDEHARSLNAKDSEHRDAISALTLKHAAVLEERLAQSHSTLQDEHDVRMKLLEDRHHETLSSLRTEHAAVMAAALEKLHTEHAQSLDESEQERAQRHFDAQQKSVQEHQEALQALRDEHAKEVSEREANLREKSKEEIATIVMQHNDFLATAQKGHEEAIAGVRAESEEAMSKLRNEHESVMTSSHSRHDEKLSQLTSDHSTFLAAKDDQHSKAVEVLRDEHKAALLAQDYVHKENLSKLSEEHSAQLAALGVEHASALQALQTSHAQALEDAQKKVLALQEQHSGLLEKHATDQQTSKRDLDTLQQNHVHVLEQIETLKTEHSERLRELTQGHSRRIGEVEESLKRATAEREALNVSHSDLEQRYQSLVEQDPNDIVTLRAELAETSDSLVTIEDALTRTQEERDSLQRRLEEMQRGDVHAQQAKQLAQAQKEVELLQASFANVRSELQRSKSDIQGMLEEKTRQESLMRELQIKLTIAETRSATGSRSRGAGDGIGHLSTSNSDSGSLDTSFVSPRSPNAKRDSTDHLPDGGGSQRGSRLGVSTNKPPPLTPPPNNPLPPTPTNGGSTTPTQRTSLIRSSVSSSSLAHLNGGGGAYGRNESPSPGLLSRSSSTTSMHSPVTASDSKTAKLMSDQAEEIEKLTRQLNHCEQDLQANIDLVATLEAALNDSERNLRKSRVQLSEATRERERHAVQCDDLRQQLEQMQKDMERERNSGQLERQGWENRIQQEREAKERARRALEARLDEVQKKKNSKLFCM